MELEEDFNIIFSSYEQTYNNSFWEDYKKINYKLFWGKIFASEGYLKDLLKARNILVGNVKSSSKEESVWAYKFITVEIEKYRKAKRDETDIQAALSGLDNIPDLFLKNRERRKKQRKRGDFRSLQLKK